MPFQAGVLVRFGKLYNRIESKRHTGSANYVWKSSDATHRFGKLYAEIFRRDTPVRQIICGNLPKRHTGSENYVEIFRRDTPVGKHVEIFRSDTPVRHS
jgi:hypothetical protein